MTEAEMVYWGLQQVVFAYKLAAACDRGDISPRVFKPEVIVRIAGDVTFKIPDWDGLDDGELSKVANNQLMVAIAACSIATDEALSRRFSKSSFKGWKRNPSNANSLREIMLLIRSAYAHKMPDVHWHISGDRRTAVYTVNTPDGVVQLDANGKNGQKLELVHFGGFRGYLNLVSFADDLLRTNQPQR